MAVIDGGITYGCSDALEKLASGVAAAGRDLAKLLAGGGTLPSTYTIKGTVFNVVKININPNGTTDNQSALASALSASRGGTPTLAVLPPAQSYYRYSAELTLSANTYWCGYGAKVKPIGIRNTRINMASSNQGMFGMCLHALPDAMSKWPERFEFDNTQEGGKDGSVALGDSGNAHCWIQVAGGSNYILKDMETTGSLAGALRAFNAANGLVEDCSAMRTHSDSWHIVQGCSFWTCRRLRIFDSGDDAISFIQYTDSPGAAQPRNHYVEQCHLKGSRARGFTCVSGRDILYRDCVVEDVTLSGYLFGAKSSHSLSNCSGIKVQNCEAWRCSRMQANNPNSGGFATLFATDTFSCTGVVFENCRGSVYGSDWYKTAFVRPTDSGAGISWDDSNNNTLTTLDRTK